MDHSEWLCEYGAARTASAFCARGAGAPPPGAVAATAAQDRQAWRHCQSCCGRRTRRRRPLHRLRSSAQNCSDNNTEHDLFPPPFHLGLQGDDVFVLRPRQQRRRRQGGVPRRHLWRRRQVPGEAPRDDGRVGGHRRHRQALVRCRRALRSPPRSVRDSNPLPAPHQTHAPFKTKQTNTDATMPTTMRQTATTALTLATRRSTTASTST